MSEELISFDDFLKVKMVVGVVLAAEMIPSSNKLYKLSVDVGEGTPRTICAGMKPYYTVEQMIGRQVVVVVNLAPRPMCGEISNGMLLAAANSDHSKVILLTPGFANHSAAEAVSPGSKVG